MFEAFGSLEDALNASGRTLADFKRHALRVRLYEAWQWLGYGARSVVKDCTWNILFDGELRRHGLGDSTSKDVHGILLRYVANGCGVSEMVLATHINHGMFLDQMAEGLGHHKKRYSQGVLAMIPRDMHLRVSSLHAL